MDPKLVAEAIDVLVAAADDGDPRVLKESECPQRAAFAARELTVDELVELLCEVGGVEDARGRSSS